MDTAFQEEKGNFVVLTSRGEKEIQRKKSFWSDVTRPIPFAKRDWRTKDVANLWIGLIVSIAVYQVASGLLVAGMTWYEALLTIVLGHTIVMFVAIILGHYGVKYGMNYRCWARRYLEKMDYVFRPSFVVSWGYFGSVFKPGSADKP